MKFGFDFDGTVFSYPLEFSAMIRAFADAGHLCYVISSHGRDEWPQDEIRLRSLGVHPELLCPDLMHHERHGDLRIKGKACDHCDVVFDDDTRLNEYTRALVLQPHPKRT